MRNTFVQRLMTIFILVTCLCGLKVCASPYQNRSPSSSLASINFWHLNNAIAVYQHAAEQGWDTIPDYPVLKPGMKNRAIITLRRHLLLTGDLPNDNNDTNPRYYDEDLQQAVQLFQKRHGLTEDGVIGKLTRAQLNINPEYRIRQLAVNMQRWADLSGKLGDRFIIVNIPDFHMYLFDHNQNVLTLRAIVGKPDLQTPQLASKITRIVFNPYWNIPKTIAKNDIAQKVLDDPNYLSKMHIKVLAGDGDNAYSINPYHINWYDAKENGIEYQLRQDPGPDNALGQVKFEFQNSQSVYMHDTSARNLFATDIRDYSHGCIRLENPFALVQYLMQDDPNWNEEKLQGILDSRHTKYVSVPHPIPIFLTYFTAWVDENGHINFRDDLYHLDQETVSPTDQEQEGSSPWEQNDGQLF